MPPRARSARRRVDEPGRRRHPRAVLGSAQHRHRPAQHRGLHAVRRAPGRGDRPPPGRLPLPAGPGGRRRRLRGEHRRCRTSSASRAASSISTRRATCVRSRSSREFSQRPTPRSTATRARRRSSRGTPRARARTARPCSPGARWRAYVTTARRSAESRQRSAPSRRAPSSARPASGRPRSRLPSAWSSPMQPYLREVGFTGPVEGLPSTMPLTVDFSTGFYFHREGPGLLFGMADREQPPGLDAPGDSAWLEKVMEVAERRLPSLLDMGIAGGWKGYYEVTPDHNALVGESARGRSLPLRDRLLRSRLPARPRGGRDRARPRPRPRAVRRRRTALGRALRPRRSQT